VASGATCATGGVEIGEQSVTQSGTSYGPAATVTAAGRYCWRADFSGDAARGVPAASDSSAGECFVVNPRTPSNSTQAGAGPVDFGQAVTDTATLTGTANRPGTGGQGNGSINPTTAGAKAGGTITLTLYKDDACGAKATGTGDNPQTVTVDGDGQYEASFTPDAPGHYWWVATYGGDPPNTTATAASDSPCDDAAEDDVVRQIPTAISTAQRIFPNDTATVSSTVSGKSLPSGGTVRFRLYGPTPGVSAAQNCAAGGPTGKLYEETDTVGGQQSVTTGTNNTSVAVDESSTVVWRVEYDPGSTVFTGRQSTCLEDTTVAFTNDAGPGTVFP
jgi:hypothetical protein